MERPADMHSIMRPGRKGTIASRPSCVCVCVYVKVSHIPFTDILSNATTYQVNKELPTRARIDRYNKSLIRLSWTILYSEWQSKAAEHKPLLSFSPKPLEYHA